MPAALKNKLRQLQKFTEKTKEIESEVSQLFEKYGLDIEYFDAMRQDDRYTEALAFVSNGEGDVEDNILEIEEVFLYYVNKNKEGA